jgi:hypothetical protein
MKRTPHRKEAQFQLYMLITDRTVMKNFYESHEKKVS